MTARPSSSSLFGTEIQQSGARETDETNIYLFGYIRRIWAINLKGIIIGINKILFLEEI